MTGSAAEAVPVRVWLAVSHHAAFRCGGWAYVRQAPDGSLSGMAGGERQVEAGRNALAGLAAALAGLPSGAAATVHALDARLAGLARWVTEGAAGDDAPAEDLDLWARIVAAARGRAVRFVRAEPAPRTPGGFCAAWAELARDKAKAAGPFSAAIPKGNLGKVHGL